MVQSTFLFIVLNLRRFLGTKVRISERKTKFICDFPNESTFGEGQALIIFMITLICLFSIFYYLCPRETLYIIHRAHDATDGR